MVVRKEGSKFVVRSKSGHKLGEHGTRKEANAQLAAVEISKERRSKKK